MYGTFNSFSKGLDICIWSVLFASTAPAQDQGWEESLLQPVNVGTGHTERDSQVLKRLYRISGCGGSAG